MSEAFNFISKRKQPLSLRQKNIQNILWYFLECYNLVLADGKTYSVSEINKGKIKLENYLRNKLVDEYLREYTHLLQDRFKTEYISFDKDSEETYIDNEGYESTDKIDIYIRNKALQDCWSGEKNVYFAIECKRIEILSDAQKYIDEDTTRIICCLSFIYGLLSYYYRLSYFFSVFNLFPSKISNIYSRKGFSCSENHFS